MSFFVDVNIYMHEILQMKRGLRVITITCFCEHKTNKKTKVMRPGIHSIANIQNNLLHTMKYTEDFQQ